MALVPSSVAAWLQAPELVAEAARDAAAFGPSVRDSRVASPLAGRADAEAEGARQLAFLGPASVRDQLRVEGDRVGLVGQCRLLAVDGAAPEPCFVLGAQELETGGTVLTVLRRL